MTPTILAPLVLALSLGAQPPGPPPALVVFDAARLDTIDQWREVSGELRALKRSLLASRQEGQVVALLIDDGTKVSEGQVIARLDDTLAQIEVRRAEADVAAKKATASTRRVELDKAKRDRDRYAQLDRPDSVSASEKDESGSRAAMMEGMDAQAAAELAAGEAALAGARERLAQLTIKAPFAGRVLRKHTEVGQWVAIGGPVAEVIALDRLEARLDVPEDVAPALAAGSSGAKVRVRATGAERSGTIEALLPEADARTRLVPVRVLLDNADGVLRPGMSITGLVNSGQRGQNLTVHKDAVLRDDAGEYVWWDAGGSAMVARVRTLFAAGDRVAVTGAIAPGAKVIVKGNERIMFPGQPLMDANAPPPPASPPTHGGGEKK